MRKNVHGPILAGLEIKNAALYAVDLSSETKRGDIKLPVELLHQILPVLFFRVVQSVAMFPNVPLYPGFVVSLPAQAMIQQI